MAGMTDQPRAISFQGLSATFQKSSDISVIRGRCAYPHLPLTSNTTMWASSHPDDAGLFPKGTQSSLLLMPSSPLGSRFSDFWRVCVLDWLLRVLEW